MMKTSVTRCRKEGFSLVECTLCLFIVSAVFVSMLELCRNLSGSTKKTVSKIEKTIIRENVRSAQGKSLCND